LAQLKESGEMNLRRKGGERKAPRESANFQGKKKCTDDGIKGGADRHQE